MKLIRIISVVALISVLAVVGAGVGCGGNGEGAAWHQPIVRVNDTVFDMSYYVKVLRLYGAGQNSQDPTQDVQLAYSLVPVIQNNELVRQEAEKLGITVSQTEVEEEVKSYLGFDPTKETEEAFNQRIDAALKLSHVSRADFEELFITPMVLQQKLQEYIGNEAFTSWLENATKSEENALEDYLDSSKVAWALGHL